MNFSSPQALESVLFNMRQSDWPRALNRAKINSLGNGAPPFSPSEIASQNGNTNVNDLKFTNVLHDARRQFYNAFLAPDPLFTVTVDYGQAWKRQGWGQIITKEINKKIKASLPYQETRRSVFALNALHGIAPSSWGDKYSWCPDADGIEDILVPTNTLVSLKNLPFFARYRQYTAKELWDMTSKKNVDPGWNIPLVKSAIEWVQKEAAKCAAPNWSEVWSPEKIEERIKQDGGFFSSDTVPTIDCWDFYYWNDEGKKSGWRRKMMLDTWGMPGAETLASKIPPAPSGETKYGYRKVQFLYDSGKRVYQDKLSKIIHFQFADCSCVSPFKYHSVRSLGFLLYSVCHLQNRLFCKFQDSEFEHMMQYFRVTNQPDAERAMKVDLTDKTPLPDNLEFVKPEERWRVDKQLIEMGFNVNRQIVSDNSSGFTQDYDFTGNSDETATRTMAKANNSAALVSAMLNQAYNYQKFQYDEIARRFCIKNSKDPDSREFRLRCLQQGVPEEVLDSYCWDIQPIRVIGSGNKMLQSAMMDKVMLFYYNKLDPSAQRNMLRLGLAVTTDDYGLAQASVPEQPTTSSSVHDAQMSAGILLQGLPMALKEGVNHSEYVEAMLGTMQVKVSQIQSRDGVGTPEELIGLQNLAGITIEGQPLQGNGIQNHINIVAEELNQPQNVKGTPDTTSVAQQVKGYEDALGKMMNEVKAFAQRASEKAQSENPQQDPATQAKIQGEVIKAQTKADLSRQTTAQKIAQKQISFEQKQTQAEQKHAQDLRQQAEQNALDVAKQMQELNDKNAETVAS